MGNYQGWASGKQSKFYGPVNCTAHAKACRPLVSQKLIGDNIFW